MDEQLKRTISGLRDWKQINSFRTNATTGNALTQEVEAAINARAAELGKVYVAEQVGIDVTNLSDAEVKIIRAVGEYAAQLRVDGKYPGRTLKQIKNRGLKGAAESSVCRNTPTQGFQILQDADREDLSYEHIILEHADEFSPRALWFARRTLGLPNDSIAPPSATEGDTQSRTIDLIDWLRVRSADNNGLLPPFTNQEAATAIGMGDLQDFGRVHGNIQSRLDFACYTLDLPPLGLAAERPFDRAWSQENRSWAFPVEEMASASQTRKWSDDDFDGLIAATARLPGSAGALWNDALTNDESRVREWANRMQGTGTAASRNPAWTRDELILALDLYIRTRPTVPDKASKEVSDLAGILNEIGQMLGTKLSATYRNENGVYMKMMNFRRFDPEYKKEGKVGLTRGNQDEERVWNKFSTNPSLLRETADAIRAALKSNLVSPADSDDEGIQEAEEGRLLTKLHRSRERSRELVKSRKKKALKENGCLSCEACGFTFSSLYGEETSEIIDCHHTKPVSTLVEGDTTRLEDLALLCANCHRVVHAFRPWLTIDALRQLITQSRQAH